jgi:AraC-like DNA-binding protein
MNTDRVVKEQTSLSDKDCFVVVQRTRRGFSTPFHVHPDYELNYFENIEGALRIVGDSTEETQNKDLVLIPGGIEHAYANHHCRNSNISEISIQFNISMFDSVINKSLFKSIQEMFKSASKGLVFSQEMIDQVLPELNSLSNNSADAFYNLLQLLRILKLLSLDKKARVLNAVAAGERGERDIFGERLNAFMFYLHENYRQEITLSEAASVVNMSEASFARFLKKSTGKSFVDTLNDIRISEALKKLVESHETIVDICHDCGFNNLSNFNRAFKRRKNMTPSKYREQNTHLAIKA